MSRLAISHAQTVWWVKVSDVRAQQSSYRVNYA